MPPSLILYRLSESYIYIRLVINLSRNFISVRTIFGLGFRCGYSIPICLFTHILHSDWFQDNVKEWLSNIGLEQYYINFQRSHIVNRSHLEILRSMSQGDIKKELNISKQGKQDICW